MLNRVVIMGRVGAHPELKKTKKDQPVTTVSLCCDRDGNRAVMQTPCDWFNVVMYDKLAENFCRYGEKGLTVIVCGRLATRKYTDIYGKDHTAIEVIAAQFYFAERKKQKDGRPPKIEEISDDGELPF